MHEKYLWPFVSQEVITSLLTETENMITKSHHTWNNIIWWTNSKWWQGRHNSCIKHRNLINLSIITDTNCCLVTPSQALMSNSKNCGVRGQFVTATNWNVFQSSHLTPVCCNTFKSLMVKEFPPVNSTSMILVYLFKLKQKIDWLV